MKNVSLSVVTSALLVGGLLFSVSEKASSNDETSEAGSHVVKHEPVQAAGTPEKRCNAELAERTITQCKVCHSVSKEAPSLTGPNLFGVYGRRAASLHDFAYSPSLRKAGITWNDQTLDVWLSNPQSFVPNTRMAFGGVRDADARAAVICYLKTLK